ncbi:DUF4280 domain-containing protein [Paenibacillus sp. MMS18-CY102]|uniref:DUF4280 domain-containing protein n=1 Tax=Paenibacillus sp. MMS18-CY102 TaxID=2682849 RepID=UPI0013657846|nr:DUF4280 domain-containing protein [Paenibacillus sp. MMS18-CY102]MWC30010.1 DUF4280 domain-containing protein [Paenibacillus sp. MMS18-CY102]
MLSLLLQMLLSGIAGGEHSYVVRGATLKCSNGTDPGVLNLPMCHGVYIKDASVMNIKDCLPITNISTFGICKETGDFCQPAFCNPAQWSSGKEDVLLDEEPALLNNSTLTCLNKGIISIENDGQK